MRIGNTQRDIVVALRHHLDGWYWPRRTPARRERLSGAPQRKHPGHDVRLPWPQVSGQPAGRSRPRAATRTGAHEHSPRSCQRAAHAGAAAVARRTHHAGAQRAPRVQALLIRGLFQPRCRRRATGPPTAGHRPRGLAVGPGRPGQRGTGPLRAPRRPALAWVAEGVPAGLPVSRLGVGPARSDPAHPPVPGRSAALQERPHHGHQRRALRHGLGVPR